MSIETDRLALLYRVSQSFSSSLDLDEVLQRVIDEVIAATNAERGFLMLVEHDDTLQFRVARGIDQASIEQPEFEVSRGIIQAVLCSGRPVLTMDAQHEDWLRGQPSVSALGLRSVLCVPLQLGETRPAGVIYVDNRIQAGAFSPADRDFLTALAASAANAIENARLYRLAVEKGRMERELQLAHAVQAHFIQRHIPVMPGWDLAATWNPAREVSGDFYDFIRVGQTQMGVSIADVSHRGMPAAIFMTLTRSIVRACVAPGLPPAEAICQANWLICDDAPNGMFVSLCFLLINVDGEITYVNGGHNPPLVFRRGQNSLEALTRTGMVLGIDAATDYQQHRLCLEPQDFVMMYTDGVTEARNEQGDEFGMDRLKAWIIEHADLPPNYLAALLQDAISEYSRSAPLRDDVTIVVLMRC